MAQPRLTDPEQRLVEQYVWVLDFMSRCALGTDRGDWFYLSDKADQLAAAAQRLSEVAREVYEAASQRRRPRPEVIRAAVAHYGRHYRAGRLLHPEGER
jgi:hypothetical protein